MGIRPVCIKGHWSVRVNYRRHRKTRQVTPNTEARAIEVCDLLKAGMELGDLSVGSLEEIEGKPVPPPASLPAELQKTGERFIEHSLNYLPPCVYFLCVGPEVVYVGQTTELAYRVGDHFKDPSKVFDRVLYLPTPKNELDNTEAKFIELLKPKYNKAGFATEESAKVARLKRYSGI